MSIALKKNRFVIDGEFHLCAPGVDAVPGRNHRDWCGRMVGKSGFHVYSGCFGCGLFSYLA
jgi:hypothetical protein